MLEYDGSTGAVLRWYAYGLGPNDVLGQINVAAGTRTMPIPDLLGSIVGSVDAGTGAVTKFGYLPYGTSAAAASPFGYTGQRIDPEAGGLYYYRARHYSPGLGRFLQTDPTGYADGPNLYAYVSNNPLNSRDPLGLASLQLAQAQGFPNPVPYPTNIPPEGLARLQRTLGGAIAGAAVFGALGAAAGGLISAPLGGTLAVPLGILGAFGGLIGGGIWGYNGGWESWLGGP